MFSHIKPTQRHGQRQKVRHGDRVHQRHRRQHPLAPLRELPLLPERVRGRPARHHRAGRGGHGQGCRGECEDHLQVTANQSPVLK